MRSGMRYPDKNQRQNLSMSTERLITARKRSLGQGNIFRSVCQEFCPQGGGGGSASPGTPPGPGRYPPGPGRFTPPGPGRYPPGPGRYPPGTRQVTPRARQVPPSSRDQAGTPPGQGRYPPRPGRYPPGQAGTPPGPGRYTPPDQAGTPRDKAGTPPDKAGTPPEIRSTRGRYASYWNAILFVRSFANSIFNHLEKIRRM